jgi:hypothetical protein
VDRAPERFAVAVIRAWVESDDEGTLKIRITAGDDSKVDRRTIGVTTDIDDASAMIRSWLKGFVEFAGRRDAASQG